MTHSESMAHHFTYGHLSSATMKDVNHTQCNHLGLIAGGRYVDAGKVSINHVPKTCSWSSLYMR